MDFKLNMWQTDTPTPRTGATLRHCAEQIATNSEAFQFVIFSRWSPRRLYHFWPFVALRDVTSFMNWVVIKWPYGSHIAKQCPPNRPILAMGRRYLRERYKFSHPRILRFHGIEFREQPDDPKHVLVRNNWPDIELLKLPPFCCQRDTPREVHRPHLRKHLSIQTNWYISPPQ